ncbi:mitochondrial carrier [Parathielavia appendiculata]|uniref:Mitochondrial carrier n=1 Tax=Parathielavia appendiculata TaxID=2587402 RepID=A0AAN6TX44_9PEZI|nr:mitochondrial carrier [Parathielavia appendiculata]
MPLVDPVTMPSTIAKGVTAQAQATSSRTTSTPPLATYALYPVQIKQTPLAQAARYALPALLAGIFAVRFRALVADPVSTMSTTLPLTAALQVAYAVLCLPVAGSQGGGGAKGARKHKARPGEGGPGSKKRPEGTGPSAVVTSLLSLLLSLLITPFLYAAMVLFGAPFLTHGAHTLLCAAHLAVLALFPLFYIHGVDGAAWAAVGSFSAPLDETFGGLVGGVVGAWLGAVPIPLDWDRDWQSPITGNTTMQPPTAAASPAQPPDQSPAHYQEKAPSNYKGFVAGVFSGIAKLAVGHPFDTIKVRLQTTTSTRFSGPLACLTQTLRNEGLVGLYKGATPPLVGWMFMDSVMLGSLSVYRRLLHENLFNPPWHPLHDPTTPLPAHGHGLAGILAGATVSFVAAPVEHVKARLQIQYAAKKSERLYSGPVDCVRKVWRHHGIGGVYHGLQATLLFRSFFFFWWGSYDLFSRWMRQHTSLSAPAINFWAGGLSAQVFWVFSYPSDVVKQRIMTDPLGGGLNDGVRRFPRWKDAAKAVYRESGAMGYWRGFLPCFLRAFPANAMALVAFEAAMRALPG